MWWAPNNINQCGTNIFISSNTLMLKDLEYTCLTVSRGQGLQWYRYNGEVHHWGIHTAWCLSGQLYSEKLIWEIRLCSISLNLISAYSSTTPEEHQSSDSHEETRTGWTNLWLAETRLRLLHQSMAVQSTHWCGEESSLQCTVHCQ